MNTVVSIRGNDERITTSLVILLLPISHIQYRPYLHVCSAVQYRTVLAKQARSAKRRMQMHDPTGRRSRATMYSGREPFPPTIQPHSVPKVPWALEIASKYRDTTSLSGFHFSSTSNGYLYTLGTSGIVGTPVLIWVWYSTARWLAGGHAAVLGGSNAD